MSLHIAVYGLGNIGRKSIESVQQAVDMVCVGCIRRAASLQDGQCERAGVQGFASLQALTQALGKKPDVVILACPSTQALPIALEYLAQGVSVVDSFDIHSKMVECIEALEPVAKQHGSVAICGAGWDPGTDSVLRAMYEAMVPVGTTFTNFGPGRSMGHSVAVRALEGVADAASVTIPIGGGRHSRLVYVLPKVGANPEGIKKRIQEDPYFVHDPLEVRFVKTDVALQHAVDNSHGVLMERIGASGTTSNQRLSFDMRIDNPALTAQVLVASARAATRLAPGSYTLIDIPPVALLPGERMHHIARLV